MRRKSGIRNLLIHIGLASISFILAFPFLWMFTNSIKTKAEIWAVPPRVLPAAAQWNNYADALGDGTFLMYMWNSAYTAVLITVIMLFNSAMFAYALTNIRFKGKTILTALIMVTYIMPATTHHIFPDHTGNCGGGTDRRSRALEDSVVGIGACVQVGIYDAGTAFLSRVL